MNNKFYKINNNLNLNCLKANKYRNTISLTVHDIILPAALDKRKGITNAVSG